MLAADDPIRNEWFPVVAASLARPGSRHPFELLDDRYLLLCSSEGVHTVVRDTCPHRGAQLSLGSFDGSILTCPYHGWQFDLAGRCVHQPAQPALDPPRVADITATASTESYGLIWVCVGPAPRELLRYPVFDQHPGRTQFLGPKTVRSSGPRVVENFLDMAHFPFVHTDYLGTLPHTEVRPYDVAVVDGELHATNCWFWQPRPGPTATTGGEVAYEYRVSHPYAAMLHKLPAPADGGEQGAFSMMLVASPETEDRCRVWMLTTIYDPDADLMSFNEFNLLIFGQDVPIVESQRPVRLPLDPQAERHQSADRMALAYRRWLVDRGVRYGTSLNS